MHTVIQKGRFFFTENLLLEKDIWRTLQQELNKKDQKY